MLTVQNFFDQLFYGDLTNTPIAGLDTDESVDTKHYPKLITYINTALTDLHSKFNLRTYEVIIKQIEGVEFYRIHSDHAETNSGSSEPKWILDSVDHPFKDNLTKILEAKLEDGTEIPLNDHTDCESYFTPQLDVLQIPFAKQDVQVILKYRQNHPLLRWIGLDDATAQVIDLPDTHVKALALHVAYQYFKGLKTTDGQAESQSNFALYQQAVIALKSEGMDIEDGYKNLNLETNGWA